MQTRKIVVVLSILALAAIFCSAGNISLPEGLELTVTAGVPAMQTELASQVTKAVQTLTAVVPFTETGSISGNLNYPADALPAMRVVAFDVQTSQPYYVDTVLHQGDYRIGDLPAGNYYVVAYSLGGGGFPSGLAGGYSAAVPCGLTEACTDHTLLPVTVTAGQDTPNIRPADWYGGTFPAMPGPAPAPQSSQPGSDLNGLIQGSLSYPSEFVPALAVVVYRVGGASTDYFYTLTQQGESTYSLSVPSGEYYVISYVQDGNYAGGYTKAVLCGLSTDCTNHALVPVSVTSGATVEGIDPGDWYGPEGTFPPNPLP